MLIDRSKWSLSGREGHVTDSREHNDSHHDGHQLQPKKARPPQHAEKERAGQRTAPKGDRTLQPSGTRQTKVRFKYG